jgi:hypothetical protein
MTNQPQPTEEQQGAIPDNGMTVTVTQEEVEAAIRKLILRKTRKVMVKMVFMLIGSYIRLLFRKAFYLLFKYIFGPVFIVYMLPGAIAFAIIETFKNSDKFIVADGLKERQEVILNLFKSRKDSKLRIFLLSLLFWGIVFFIV